MVSHCPFVSMQKNSLSPLKRVNNINLLLSFFCVNASLPPELVEFTIQQLANDCGLVLDQYYLPNLIANLNPTWDP